MAASSRTLPRSRRREIRQEVGITRWQALHRRGQKLRRSLLAHWRLGDRLGGHLPSFGEAVEALRPPRVAELEVLRDARDALEGGNWARHAPPPGMAPIPAVPTQGSVLSASALEAAEGDGGQSALPPSTRRARPPRRPPPIRRDAMATQPRRRPAPPAPVSTGAMGQQAASSGSGAAAGGAPQSRSTGGAPHSPHSPLGRAGAAVLEGRAARGSGGRRGAPPSQAPAAEGASAAPQQPPSPHSPTAGPAAPAPAPSPPSGTRERPSSTSAPSAAAPSSRDGREPRRRYSVLSQEALALLSRNEDELRRIEARVADLAAAATAGGEPLAALRAELAQLEADAHKLEAQGVDNIYTGELHSGKSEAKQQKKAMLTRLEALFEKVDQAFQVADGSKRDPSAATEAG